VYTYIAANVHIYSSKTHTTIYPRASGSRVSSSKTHTTIYMLLSHTAMLLYICVRIHRIHLILLYMCVHTCIQVCRSSSSRQPRIKQVKKKNLCTGKSSTFVRVKPVRLYEQQAAAYQAGKLALLAQTYLLY
jgi:hypothetical protein